MTRPSGFTLIVYSKNKKGLKRFIETIHDYIHLKGATWWVPPKLFIYQNHLYIDVSYECCISRRSDIKDRLKDTERIVKTFPSFYCELWTGKKEGVFVGTQNELSNLYISKMRPTIPLHPHTLYEEKHGGYTCTICGYEDGGKEYTWQTCRPCNYGECTICYAESRRLLKVASVLSFPSLESRIDFSTAGKAVDWSVFLDHPFGEEGEKESKTLEETVKKINENYASDWYKSIYKQHIDEEPAWLEVHRLHSINYVTERHKELEKIKKILFSSVDLEEYIEREGKEGLAKNLRGSESQPPPPPGTPLFVSDD
jgi:hypothetical protein